MKKSASLTLSFPMMLAAIVVALVLVGGGYLVVSSLSAVSDVEKGIIAKEIDDTLSPPDLYPGSFRKSTIGGLQDYDEMCAVDLNSFTNYAIFDDYPLIKGELVDKTANVFLIKKDGSFDSYMQNDIVIEYPYFDCSLVSQGSVTVETRGMGALTSVAFTDSSDTLREQYDSVPSHVTRLSSELSDFRITEEDLNTGRTLYVGTYTEDSLAISPDPESPTDSGVPFDVSVETFDDPESMQSTFNSAVQELNPDSVEVLDIGGNQVVTGTNDEGETVFTWTSGDDTIVTASTASENVDVPEGVDDSFLDGLLGAAESTYDCGDCDSIILQPSDDSNDPGDDGTPGGAPGDDDSNDSGPDGDDPNNVPGGDDGSGEGPGECTDGEICSDDDPRWKWKNGPLDAGWYFVANNNGYVNITSNSGEYNYESSDIKYIYLNGSFIESWVYQHDLESGQEYPWLWVNNVTVDSLEVNVLNQSNDSVLLDSGAMVDFTGSYIVKMPDTIPGEWVWKNGPLDAGWYYFADTGSIAITNTSGTTTYAASGIEFIYLDGSYVESFVYEREDDWMWMNDVSILPNVVNIFTNEERVLLDDTVESLYITDTWAIQLTQDNAEELSEELDGEWFEASAFESDWLYVSNSGEVVIQGNKGEQSFTADEFGFIYLENQAVNSWIYMNEEYWMFLPDVVASADSVWLYDGEDNLLYNDTNVQITFIDAWAIDHYDSIETMDVVSPEAYRDSSQTDDSDSGTENSDGPSLDISVEVMEIKEVSQDGKTWGSSRLKIDAADDAIKMWGISFDCPSNIGELRSVVWSWAFTVPGTCGDMGYVNRPHDRDSSEYIFNNLFERLDSNSAPVTLHVYGFDSRDIETANSISETDLEFTLP